MRTKKILLSFFLVLGFLFLLTPETEAVYCSTSTINGSCEFQFAADGIDSGGAGANTAALTVSAGGNLLIGANVVNQELAIGKLVLNGGSVTIYNGAKLRIGAKVWMIDADGDGYPSSTTRIIQETQPANAGRMADMTSNSVPDCDDTKVDVRPNQTNYFGVTIGAGGPKAGTFDYNCDGVATKQYTSGAAYACDPTGCAAHYYTATSGWADGSNAACGTTEAYYTVSYTGTCNTSNYDACPYTTQNLNQGCR